MWGITGIVYNPEVVSKEEASTWRILDNPKFKRQVTIKDNVRDSYFAAVGALKRDLLISDDFKSSPDYAVRLESEMNDVSGETIQKVQDYLQDVKDNVYSFETDSGKSDMVTGKVVANYQWSGDAVYSLDQAEEDDFILNFAVPEESTNIYFDGWVMLKCGVEGDPDKHHAAEAFINFCSRPDNAIRNMYYIGYTSVISGGDDPRMFEYAQYCYEAEDDEEEIVEYDLASFFSEDPEESDGEFVIEAPAEQLNRQLYSQYPPADVIDRSSIMTYFDDEQNARINQMWINVRCFDIRKASWWSRILVIGLIILAVGYFVRRWHRNKA
jgi:spermidine/putrescine transport system substrate-binding protein